jgi:hypothetical protein
MSSNIAEIAIAAPLPSNPLDVIPAEMPFDVPYGRPISLERAEAVIHAAVAEARKRNWKMNIAVADSGGNLVAFQRMDGAMPCLDSDCGTQGASSRDLPPPNEGLRGRHQPYASQLSTGVRWGHCISRRHSIDRPRRYHRRNRLFGRHGFTGRSRGRGRRGSN